MTSLDNIGEGKLTPRGGRNLRVFVMNQRKQPLMPTTPGKARILLKQGKAKVVKRTPFTIQLLYATGETIQEVSLGVDAGTKHIGLSVTTEKEALFEAEVELRTDIQELLAARVQFRRSRRSRKTRYRKARFLNRKKPEDWLAPSVKHKVNSHIQVIKKAHEILPIKNIIIEVAQFDTQKLKNPKIQGVEYQQGVQLDFWNVREYVLFRDKHTCQWCKGESKDKVLNVHHIESRKTGGDSPDNLITLCKTCHDKTHREGLETLFKRKSNPLRDASQLTVLGWFIHKGVKEIYPHVRLTYGYITKNTRITNELEKSHYVDARCISGNPLAKSNGTYYQVKQVRKNNRQLHKANPKKGIRKSNKAERYVKGFQLFDKVEFEGQECFLFGRRKSGYFDVRLLDGTKLSAGVSYNKLKLVEKAKTYLWEVWRIPPRPIEDGVSCAS